MDHQGRSQCAHLLRISQRLYRGIARRQALRASGKAGALAHYG